MDENANSSQLGVGNDLFTCLFLLHVCWFSFLCLFIVLVCLCVPYKQYANTLCNSCGGSQLGVGIEGATSNCW